MQISKLGMQPHARIVSDFRLLNKPIILILHILFALRMIIVTEYMMLDVTNNPHSLYVDPNTLRNLRIPSAVHTQKLVIACKSVQPI